MTETFFSTSQEATALNAFIGNGLRAVPNGGKRWRLLPSHGSESPTHAHIEESAWLCLDAPLGDGRQHALRADDLWAFLRQNAHIRSGVKFALTPEGLSLRAEIPLDSEDEARIAQRTRAACRDIQRAWQRLRLGESEGSRERTPCRSDELAIPATDAGPVTTVDLPRLCHETGWSFTQRKSGSLIVNLDVAQGFHQGIVEPSGKRGVRVFVTLTESPSLLPPCRHALSVLLLTACGAVRMARAALEEEMERIAVLFEVLFPTPPDAGELAHALSALSVAARLTAAEVNALHEERVAKIYLAQRGWSE